VDEKRRQAYNQARAGPDSARFHRASQGVRRSSGASLLHFTGEIIAVDNVPVNVQMKIIIN
jgi:hypothetical protein